MKKLTELSLRIAELMGRPRKHSREEKDACAKSIERMVANVYVVKDLAVAYRKQKEMGLVPATYAASQAKAAAASEYRRARRATASR